MILTDLEPRAFLGADAISPSELGTLARCEQAWWYSYATERERTEPSAAMQLGSEIHRLLAEGGESDNETATWIVDRYHEFWLGDPEIMYSEVPIAAKIPAGPWFFGFADAIAAHSGELWVVEHKTTGDLRNVEYLSRTLQMPLYVWALRQMGVPVVGAMLDVISTKRLKTKEIPLAESFDRRWFRWSDPELVPAVAEAMAAVHIRSELRGDDIRRRVPLRNVGSACSWCGHQASCFQLDAEILDDEEPF